MSTTPEELAAELVRMWGQLDPVDEWRPVLDKAANELGRLSMLLALKTSALAEGQRQFERAIDERAQLGAEVVALRDALWKACGDDREVVNGYLEAVGFPQAT